MVTSWRIYSTLILLSALLFQTALADIHAQIKNTEIQEGDVISLVLSDTDNSGDMPDLAPLQKDFDVLNVSTHSERHLTNGKVIQLAQWDVSLLPKHKGAITIPVLSQGSHRTQAINIHVKNADANQTIPNVNRPIMEASLEHDSVYLNGQALLRIRIKHRGNVSPNGINFEEIDLPNTQTQQVHAYSYQRVIDNTPVIIFEFVFALHPEQVGDVNIPSIQAVLTLGRSMFNNRQTRHATQPLTLKVLPLPEEADALEVITANDLHVAAKWSDKLDTLKVGDSITQTLTFTAKGASSDAIPPLFSREIDGIKQYQDQPVLEDTADKTGITGTRKESTAYVLTQAGEFVIPERKIYWVDAITGTLNTALIPETRLNVAASTTPKPNPLTTPVQQPPQAVVPSPVQTVIKARSTTDNPWFWVSCGLALLWLITLTIMWRYKPQAHSHNKPHSPKPSSQDALFENLLQKCSKNNPSEVLDAFNEWGKSLNPLLTSNADICRHLNNKNIKNAIYAADRCVFDTKCNNSWQGDPLAKALKAWRNSRDNDFGKNLPELYP